MDYEETSIDSEDEDDATFWFLFESISLSRIFSKSGATAVSPSQRVDEKLVIFIYNDNKLILLLYLL
jgi:hypothetical protein